jgi:hypothetical protein
MDEKVINIRLQLPKDINYKLNIHMAKMKLKERRTKADEIIRLMMIGLLNESKSKL